MRALISEAQRQVALGNLSLAEAEGALLGALNWLAPDDAESAQARTLAQVSADTRARVKAFEQRLGQMQQERLASARAALLAIPDDEWIAAGGTL